MSGSGAPRPSVRLEAGDGSWRVYDAWRTPEGLGLAYFVRTDGEAGDRRAELAPGRTLDDYGADGLRALWAEAAALTPTERRVVDPAGDLWLVQAVGPVWAEGGSASDAVGLRARCLSSQRPDVVLDGTTPSDLSDAELVDRLAPPGEDGLE